MKRIINKVHEGREYLFSTPTKAIEFLNGICALMFGLVFLMNGSTLGKFKFYLSFAYVGPLWVWWFVVILGAVQLNAMRKDTLESNMLSAIFLKLSALMWFLSALMFGSDYPPLSTGFFTYVNFSLVTVLAGFHLSIQNTFELLLRDEVRIRDD